MFGKKKILKQRVFGEAPKVLVLDKEKKKHFVH